jgi:hypothetical protein
LIDQNLVSFVIANEPVHEKDLLARLSKLLPSHAIPDAICDFQSFPLTLHGKIDRKKLIEHWKSTFQLADLHEETLLSHLSQLSGSNLHPDDYFIAKGGDSMKALRMVSLIANYHGELLIQANSDRGTR